MLTYAVRHSWQEQGVVMIKCTRYMGNEAPVSSDTQFAASTGVCVHAGGAYREGGAHTKACRRCVSDPARALLKG